MQGLEEIEECATKCGKCPNREICVSSKPSGIISLSPVSGENGHTHVARVYDVVIIGAGAIGCSIARELSKYQLSVLVLEKCEDVSQGASKANSGIIHGGYDDHHNTIKAQMSHKGNHMFQQLNEDLNFGYRRTGSMVLAFSEEETKILRALLENGNKNGVENLQILPREEILKREPHVNPNVYAALYCPCAGITSPYEYVIALAENAIANGVEILLNHEITDIQQVSNDTTPSEVSSVRGEHFLVRSSRDSFRGRVLVNAAGLMADRIAAMVGANNFYITPRKGEYVILNHTQASLVNHVLFPVPSPIRGKGVLVSPTYHGNLLLGPTSRGTAEANMTQRQVLQMIISSARHSVPDFDASEAITSYTGLRAQCSRGDFIIEESTAVAGFINVAGIDSPGLTSSPAVGKRVVEIIQTSLKSEYGIDLTPKPDFNPYRRPIIIPKSDDFEGHVDHPRAELNIICRCEKVTESEIVDSIHRPLGANSTDAVKRRTRAGAGACQGHFCEPRVAYLISRELNIPLETVPKRAIGSSILPHRRVNDEDRQLLEELALSAKL